MLKVLLVGSALSLPAISCAESYRAHDFAFNIGIELADEAPLYAARLRLAWRAHELLFVARGPPPYKLAFANTTVRPISSTVESLIVRLEHDHGNTFGVALLSMPIIEIDRAFLQTPPQPVAWRLIVLWVVLAGGVCTLGWIAFNLLRELRPA